MAGAMLDYIMPDYRMTVFDLRVTVYGVLEFALRTNRAQARPMPS